MEMKLNSTKQAATLDKLLATDQKKNARLLESKQAMVDAMLASCEMTKDFRKTMKELNQSYASTDAEIRANSPPELELAMQKLNELFSQCKESRAAVLEKLSSNGLIP